MSMRAAKVIFCIVLFISSFVSQAARLESVVVQQVAGVSTIVCTVSGTFHHKAFALTQPNRVVLDLEQTTTLVSIPTVRLGQGVIVHARSGKPNTHTLRIVFDVTSSVSLQTQVLPVAGSNRHTVRMVLRPRVPSAGFKKLGWVDQSAPIAVNSPVARRPVHAAHAPARSMRDVVVVLDPGHGGKDPGATGPRHTLEKNIVLAIALKLKQHIDRQPGMRAVLTRNGDYYVGLRERMHIARKNNGDIFVAIHADAFGNHQSNGASVFALSQRGATSEAARWLAEKENYSELGGVNLSDLDDRNGVIRTVLIDLSQTATIGASLQMGDRVLRRLDKMTTLHNNHVEQARFMVLKSPDIPSVLIETGFISNPREEANLSSPAYQTRMTLAIFEGIKGYFWDYPPHGTRIEAMSNMNQHWARSDEKRPVVARRSHGFRAPWG